MQDNKKGTLLKFEKADSKLWNAGVAIQTHIDNLIATYGEETVMLSLKMQYDLVQASIKKNKVA